MMKRGAGAGWVVFLALSAFFLAFAADAARMETPPPDLSGRWRLNEEVTYRMMQSARDGGEMMRRGGGHMGGGRSGGGRPGGSGGGGRPGGDGSRMGRGEGGRGNFSPPPSLEALDEVTFVQRQGEVTITDSTGRTRKLRTDWKKVKDESAPGGPETVRARWKEDGTLEVRIKPEEGPKLTESWIITNDRKRLFLALTLDGGPPFPIRRAYDLVLPEEQAENPTTVLKDGSRP